MPADATGEAATIILSSRQGMAVISLLDSG